MKNFFLAFIMNLALGVSGYSQTSLDSSCHDYSMAIHFTSPIGLLSKAGVKLEIRNGNRAFLVNATTYYAIYRGYQFALEGRRYLELDRGARGQYYSYIKGIVGHQNELEAGSGFGQAPEATYIGGGVGVGRHITFNHFFLDFNLGLKYVGFDQPGVSDIFYITGPGAVVDLHFNWGFQF